MWCENVLQTLCMQFCSHWARVWVLHGPYSIPYSSCQKSAKVQRFKLRNVYWFVVLLLNAVAAFVVAVTLSSVRTEASVPMATTQIQKTNFFGMLVPAWYQVSVLVTSLGPACLRRLKLYPYICNSPVVEGWFPTETVALTCVDDTVMVFTRRKAHTRNLIISGDISSSSFPPLQVLQPDFRLDYCRLWQALIKGDMPGVERYSRRLGAGDLYPLFACVLTARSWTSVNAGISSVPVTKSEVCPQ